MFDFPGTPTNGQMFTPVTGGPSYVFQSPVWRLAAGGVNPGFWVGDAPPSSPVQGTLWWESDSGNSYIWYDDGSSAQWVQFNIAPPVVEQPSFIRQQLIAASGAITLHAETKAFQVECQGGGAGGGANAAPAAGQGAAGTGGGAGGYCSKWIIRPSGVYAPTCTVGVGSVGGGSGTASTFTDGTNTLTANGGSAGGAGAAAACIALNGGAGGSASGGDVNVQGERGGVSQVLTVGTVVQSIAGRGGETRFGVSGAQGMVSTASASGAAGTDGIGYGAGGTGAYGSNASGARSGGTGAPGLVVITEYR